MWPANSILHHKHFLPTYSNSKTGHLLRSQKTVKENSQETSESRKKPLQSLNLDQGCKPVSMGKGDGGPKLPPRKSMGARTAAEKRRLRELQERMRSIYTKAFGDAVMITATHLASDRIGIAEQPVLIATVVSVWWIVSGFRRDYDCNYDFRPSSIYVGLGLPVFYGVTGALVTWLAVVPGVLGIFSLMVSQNLINPSLVLPTTNIFMGYEVQGVPELEVLLALSVTVSCWRGIHAGFGSY